MLIGVIPKETEADTDGPPLPLQKNPPPVGKRVPEID